MQHLEAIDYLAIAAELLRVPSDEIHHIADLADVESALAAPFAEFGGVAFYPEPYERAAILCSRLIRNHPLPDGNKRSAWVAMRMFLTLNGLPFTVPQPDEVELVVTALAASETTEAEFVTWVRAQAP